jgi:surface protein
MEIKTLNEQIERLRELIRKCYGAVAGKNGTVPEVGERNMENLPAAIGSIKSASEVPKVKVASLRVNNYCINEDGRWEGETLIDTSFADTIKFDECSNLKYIDCSFLDTSNLNNLGQSFRNCENLITIKGIENWNTYKVTNMNQVFYACLSLSELNIENWNVSNVTSMWYMFSNMNLTSLDLSKWSVPNLVDSTNMFRANPKLKSLIGNRTTEEVLENNIGCLSGLKISLSLNYTTLDRASIRAVINGLADVTDQPAESRPTLTLGATLMAKLTDEDRVIATEKGWTLS